MAHEDVFVSVGSECRFLLDDGVGDVLVIEDVVISLAVSGVYLILIAPMARAVLGISQLIKSFIHHIIISLSHH